MATSRVLIFVAGVKVFAYKTGLKVGDKAVRPPGEVLSSFPKGEARLIRKALRAAGFPRWAAARREF